MEKTQPTTTGFTLPESASEADRCIGRAFAHSVISAGQDSPPCVGHMTDDSDKTVLSYPQLPDRDIKLPNTDICGSASHNLQPATLPATDDRQSRGFVGGKGLFLHLMQQAGIPVPPFTVVDTTLIARLEQQSFPAICLLPFLPDIGTRGQASFSLEQLRTIVTELPHQQQSKWLKGLSEFIASEDFYQQVENISAARYIRHRYFMLRQQASEACIVRSSGVDEDCFGNAQAGRYDSRVHGGGDILKTCLQVLSSAYRPEVCPNGQVKPMALVLQQCIHCQLGGVVISHSTLQDNAIQVEYALGQPRGAVSGTTGIRPHRYTIRRSDDKNSQPNRQFTPGDITTQFVLEKITDEETGEAGYIERSNTATTDAKDIMLSDEILQELQKNIEKLEDMFCCPVDAEFGVDGDLQLHVFQSRPVTELPGSTRFSAPAPTLPLAKGTMVSEGCCSGVALMVTEPVNAEQIPPGAILFANHASDWMLAPDILKRLGGCVFKQGGTNDHVAITLRQAGVSCLLAGSQYSEALRQSSGQQVTLVAGSFVGSPGACLLSGDQSAYWQARSTTSGQDIISSAATSPAEPPDFTRVDDGFAWLNRQNHRLLDYFHPDRITSRCLGPGRSKAVSMSANRSKLLQQLDLEIQQLQKDLDLFVSGYQHFLGLATASESNTAPSKVKPFTEVIHLLEKHCKSLKDAIDKLRLKVVLPLTTELELPDQPANFRQWLSDCQTLQDRLQKLTRPISVLDISSAHDLVYWLHQQFVLALDSVAEASGQGQITKITDARVLINILPQGALGLLNDKCMSVASKLPITRLRMLNMVDAAFVSAKLGVHVCTISMLEEAEGGRGRTLRLDISDNFSENGFNTHLQGKLKRFWFLVQTLRCASIDSDSLPMAISFNKNAWKMTIEYTQVDSKKALQDSFVKLVTVLSGLTDLDMSINKFNRGENLDEWNFETLVKKSQIGLSDSVNNWIFKHCLIVDVFESRDVRRCYKNYAFVDYLDDECKLLHEVAKKTHETLEAFRAWYRSSELRQMLADASKQLKPDDAARITKELLTHMVIEDFHPELTFTLLREDFNLDHDKDLVLFLIEQNPMLFRFVSDAFRDDFDIANSAIRSRGRLLKYASDRFKKDKSLVMHAISDPGGISLEYASTDLKNDPEVVMAATRYNYHSFQYAGQTVKNNESLLRVLIAENPLVLIYATESLKNDKDFVLPVLSGNTHIYENVHIYKYLSDRLKSDPDIMAAAGHPIKIEPETASSDQPEKPKDKKRSCVIL
ncbi:DUF4116 domain-containing protein [Endozoicomonas sp. ALD040]|uniref:DUF4116 domain-containing protein n=1 Tax=Endozoicomonas sp. ALD040 TaxID=3403079 RepID=UPI003BAF7878